MKSRILIVIAGLAGLLNADTADDLQQKARTILQEGYADKNPDTRRDVAAAIGLIGAREKVVSGLEQILKDPDYQVRAAAVGALADLRDKSTVPLLEQALRDSVPEVAFPAARALWALKEQSGREALLAIYQKQEKGSSNALTSTWRKTRRQLKTPRSALMFGMQQGMGFVPVPGLGMGYSAVESMVSDPTFSVRATAFLMLSSQADEGVVALAHTGLIDDDWSVRAVSIQILAMQGKPSDGAAVARLFDDKKQKVRFRAAAAYLRFGLEAQ